MYVPNDNKFLRKNTVFVLIICFILILIILSGLVAHIGGMAFLVCELTYGRCSELSTLSKYCSCRVTEKEKTKEEKKDFILFKPEEKNQKQEYEKRTILITSLPRSGSSFLGEIFNRQKDVFYFYEPLQPLNALSQLISSYNYEKEAVTLLSNFFVCNFEGYQDYFNFLSFPELSNPHFRLMSRVLSMQPFCAKRVLPNSTVEEYTKYCVNINVKLLRKSCNTKSTFVIKELLHRLPSDVSKIEFSNYISLIRDPRAIVWSMKKNKWVENKGYFASTEYEAIEKVCRIFRNNYFSMLNNNRLNKLVILRYEDLVKYPKTTLKDLFQVTKTFFYRNIDDTVEWVNVNTHGKSETGSSSFSVLMKNASYSLNSWRENLSFGSVLEIQNKCGDVMQQLGYVLYTSSKDLRDFSKTSVVRVKKFFK
ncbi:carbohydrate sulfotransferase 1 [Hydra vulgaris]|uniref:carbohydrate sulfotransferase 1 n=1 Tax=Hydra vulgaris TaxID=6087 RepID=UPI000640CA21|nr:carbohydrate sulfotransferase 1 [Hydra vulgaris]